jgi:hypothetical protein
LLAEAGAVCRALLGNQRFDPLAAELITGGLPLIAAIGLDDRDQIEAIVAVRGGEQTGERDPGRVASPPQTSEAPPG